jgi:hypothetical protein
MTVSPGWTADTEPGEETLNVPLVTTLVNALELPWDTCKVSSETAVTVPTTELPVVPELDPGLDVPLPEPVDPDLRLLPRGGDSEVQLRPSISCRQVCRPAIVMVSNRCSGK